MMSFSNDSKRGDYGNFVKIQRVKRSVGPSVIGWRYKLGGNGRFSLSIKGEKFYMRPSLHVRSMTHTDNGGMDFESTSSLNLTIILDICEKGHDTDQDKCTIFFVMKYFVGILDNVWSKMTLF